MATIYGLQEISSGRPVAGLRLLRLRVIAGIHLAKKDIFGASDPYVKIILYKGERNKDEIDVIQTKTIKKTLNPKWYEEHLFRVNPAANRILFEVYDENRMTRDDFLGLVEIPLVHTHIPEETRGRTLPPKDYILRPRSARSRVKGHLRLYLAYVNENVSDNTPTTLVTPGTPVTPETPETPGTPIPQPVLQPQPQPSQNEPGWEMVDVAQSMRALMLAGNEDNNQQTETDTETDTDIVEVDESNIEVEEEEPLPEGWEEREDVHGRKFYVNHERRTTQWERPNEQNLLPSGWDERTDANGRVYYVDHNTHVTQWERPTVASLSGDEREVTASAVRQLYALRRHVSLDDTIEHNDTNIRLSQHHFSRSQSLASRTSSNSENETQSDTPSSGQEEEDPLPAGWTQSTTEAGRAFYIDHNTRKTSWDDPRHPRHHRTSSLRTPAPHGVERSSSNVDLLKDLGPLPAGWEERMHADGRTFYIDHNTKKTQWEDPRLQKLGGPAVPYSRDYKRKYDYFRSKLRKPENVPNKVDIKVSRKSILEDSFRVVMGFSNTNLLKTRLWIEFQGEIGLDYGGVAREWFYLLSKEMFNPYYGLFEYSATDNYTLQINALSGFANEEHLTYFKFIGRVAGMAVYHGKLLDGFFIRPFYKMMLGKQITLQDMESVDSEYHNSLKWILDNDPSVLDLYFSVSEETFGKMHEVELKPGGENVQVTDDNKAEYIDLVIKWRFVSRVKNQMRNFMAGFNEIIPCDMLQMFDENEVELLLCGLQDIDVNDWKKNTAYRGDYAANHPVVLHFWRAVYSMNNEMRARLLQFVTGTSRVPMNGFNQLYGSNGPQLFTIEKWGNAKQLPRAHTCFNRIDLPPYESYNELRGKLITAVENTAGFEGVD